MAILITVTKVSANGGQREVLAVMTIANTGGTDQRGDYIAKTFRKDDKTLESPYKSAAVLGYARRSSHVWNLVAKALTGLGYK